MDTEENTGNFNSFRGDGGEGLYQRPIREDVKLITRAIKERWPIPDNVRSELHKHLIDILKQGKDDRARVGAAKIIIEADRLNLDAEKFEHEKAKADEANANGTAPTGELGRIAAALNALVSAPGNSDSGDAGATADPAVDTEAGSTDGGVSQ